MSYDFIQDLKCMSYAINESGIVYININVKKIKWTINYLNFLYETMNKEWTTRNILQTYNTSQHIIQQQTWQQQQQEYNNSSRNICHY